MLEKSHWPFMLERKVSNLWARLSNKPFILLLLASCYCLLFSNNKLLICGILTPHWISWLHVQHRLLSINKEDVLLRGFWLNVLTGLGLVLITAVTKMLGAQSERTCTWKIWRVSVCLLNEDRCPLPLNLLNQLVYVYSFRIIRHLQQAASFCPLLYSSCFSLIIPSLHQLWRVPLNSPPASVIILMGSVCGPLLSFPCTF